MELEGKWLAFLELEIVDVRLCRDLDALFLHELLISLSNERLEGFLSDSIPELLSHHRRWCLPGPESGKPHSRRVAPRRFILGVLDRLRGHGNLYVSFDPLRCAGRELDFHASNITDWQRSKRHSYCPPITSENHLEKREFSRRWNDGARYAERSLHRRNQRPL